MITHIVFLKLKPELDKDSTLENLKNKLLDLKNYISVLKHLEVGFDFNGSAAAFDLALYTTFASKADLNSYQIHPEHEKVKAYIGKVTESRAVVDYEL